MSSITQYSWISISPITFTSSSYNLSSFINHNRTSFHSNPQPCFVKRPLHRTIYISQPVAIYSPPTESNHNTHTNYTKYPLNILPSQPNHQNLPNILTPPSSSSSSQSTSIQNPISNLDLTTQQVDKNLLSPMMSHYVSMKRSIHDKLVRDSNRSAILMYRCGDFFESFFEDARLLSQICQIALTTKDGGKALGSRVHMAGVPHYTVDDKIKMLLANNITVAVVDQVQPSANTPSGTLVKRVLTRLITPGTASEETFVDSKHNSYIASVVVDPRPKKSSRNTANSKSAFHFGLSFADVSTGEFKVTQAIGIDALTGLLASIEPAELLIAMKSPDDTLKEQIMEAARSTGIAVITTRKSFSENTAEHLLKELQNVDSVESLGCRRKPFCVEAAAILLHFISEALNIDGDHEKLPSLNILSPFQLSDVMMLDLACLKNLEILESARDGVKERSLQWAVNRTTTGMGSRRLRSWLLNPSTDLDVIKRRHDLVEALANDQHNRREHIQSMLKNLADLERLSGQVDASRATPRELRWLCESIIRLPAVFSTLRQCLQNQPGSTGRFTDEELAWIPTVDERLLKKALEVIDALVDPAPSSIVSELAIYGGTIANEGWTSPSRIFQRGYSSKLDELTDNLHNSSEWVTTLEEKEQKRTAVDKLSIRHIKNTGYVVRVPRSVGEKKLDEDPLFFSRLGYDRAQSTKSELRFRFRELQTRESEQKASMSDVLLLELRLFDTLRSSIGLYLTHLRDLGHHISSIDVLAGFAQVAVEHDYTRPVMHSRERQITSLEDARHAIVEQSMGATESFVPNSFRLGSQNGSPDMMIVCGPNAAGKSCALRSVGLAIILAQAGCFVPARRAELSICDRVLTRVGAADDVARGQSTFQVEMAETAGIVAQADASSIVLLDEVGRGTGTADGIAVAWSVAEFLACRSYPPRVMFATHYHELNELPGLLDNIKTFHMEVQKIDDGGWIATHRVVPGSSYSSMGISVAERAGLPGAVVNRAREIASVLRKPSRALGVELRKALGTGTVEEIQEEKMFKDDDTLEDEDEEIYEMRRRKSKPDRNSILGIKLFGGKEYKRGYWDGYDRAVTDMQQQLLNIEMMSMTEMQRQQ